VEIVRNEDYWDKKAYLDKVISKYVPESSVRLSEVETGSSHLFDSVGVRDIDRVKSNPQLRLLMIPFPAWAYAYFNLRLPPMDNKKVRQAICYGVDTEAIIKNLYNGIGQWPDAGPLAPGLTGYQPGLNPYKYDPVKAKALLGEAGVGAGLKLSMAAYNYERPYIPAGGGKVAQAIQADLKRLGIDVDLQVLDSAPFAALRNDPAKRPQLLLGGFFDDFPDQDEFIFYNGESTQTFNRSSWKNDEFDKLVREARRISNEGERARLYQRAAKIWLEDPPQLIINYGVDASVVRKTVQNAFLTPLLTWRFDRVWLSE
jgi:ABC-type transport system substrate-binding protein